MSQEDVYIATGRKASSVAPANRDAEPRIQLSNRFLQNFFNFLNFLPRDSFFKVVKMFEANFLPFRQAVLMLLLKMGMKILRLELKLHSH